MDVWLRMTAFELPFHYTQLLAKGSIKLQSEKMILARFHRERDEKWEGTKGTEQPPNLVSIHTFKTCHATMDIKVGWQVVPHVFQW